MSPAISLLIPLAHLATLACLLIPPTASLPPTNGHTQPPPLFSRADVSIPEAPPANQIPLLSHPRPDVLASPVRARVAATLRSSNGRNGSRPLDRGDVISSPHGRRQSGAAVVHTIYSGIYPVVNVTWGNKDGVTGQQFVSFVDTGSSDTFAVWDGFECESPQTFRPRAQDACAFGRPLYDLSAGSFTNLTALAFAVAYFPEMDVLGGSMGLAPLSLGGGSGVLAVPAQEAALVSRAAWAGDGVSAGLLGLGGPMLTSASYRDGSGRPAPYSPVFTTMARRGIVGEAVFALAIDRVPEGTPPLAPAGWLALGGLVPESYYERPFTSVPIIVGGDDEDQDGYGDEGGGGGEGGGGISDALGFYTISHELLYGPPGSNATSSSGGRPNNNSIGSTGTYQSIVDSGTAPCFVPSAAARAINALFSPPARYNATLGYSTVDCGARAPWVAYRIGGAVMPMDPRDMVVRSLNGLPGFEGVCFSAFADGDGSGSEVQIIGATWQRGYVVTYDQGRQMLHFAKRRPY